MTLKRERLSCARVSLKIHPRYMVRIALRAVERRQRFGLHHNQVLL